MPLSLLSTTLKKFLNALQTPSNTILLQKQKLNAWEFPNGSSFIQKHERGTSSHKVNQRILPALHSPAREQQEYSAL